jgi:hypothetical protein
VKRKREARLELRGGSWRGTADHVALWLAADLRRARTKAERLQIAADLEQLSAFITRQRLMPQKGGRPQKRDTFTRFRLAVGLVHHHGLKNGTAARLVSDTRAGAERVRDMLRRWQRGEIHAGIMPAGDPELAEAVARTEKRRK